MNFPSTLKDKKVQITSRAPEKSLLFKKGIVIFYEHQLLIFSDQIDLILKDEKYDGQWFDLNKTKNYASTSSAKRILSKT